MQKELRHKSDFFGTTVNKQIHIYLSSVELSNAEVIAHSGIRDKFSGKVLMEKEFRIIPEIVSLFPSGLLSKGLFSGIMEAFSSISGSYFLFKNPSISYIPSPKQDDSGILSLLPSQSTVICIGSPIYNSITRYYQNHEPPSFIVKKDKLKGLCEIQLIRNGSVENITTRSFDGGDIDIGSLVKVRDKNGNTVFIAGGLGVNATCAAIVYLKNNWRELYSKYRDRDFGVLIKCPHINKDSNGYIKPILVFDVEGNGERNGLPKRK
jgi:hypothetical protein